MTDTSAFPIERLRSALAAPEAPLSLFRAALHDPRQAVRLAAVEFLPLPVPEHEAPVPEGLPGLYTAFATVYARSRRRTSERKDEGEQALVDTYLEQVSTLAELIARDAPVWHWLLFNQPDTLLRRAAIARLPTPTADAAPLGRLWPALTLDADRVVVRMAHARLNMPTRQSWREYARAREGYAVARAAGAAGGETSSMRLADSRAGVRYAAALALASDAPEWALLAADPSPRLRRLAAERMSVTAPAFTALLKDSNASVIRAASQRRLAAFDAEEPYKEPEEPDKARARADRAQRRAQWQKMREG